MAQIIGLPKLSPTMEEGVLVRWVKKEGDSVEPGDLVAEVETDKANMDFNLEDEGVLLKLLVSEGETVRLGAPVAILGEAGEDITALVEEARSGGGGADTPPEPAQQAAPAPAPSSQPASTTQPAAKPTAPKPTAAKPTAPVPASPPPPASGGRILASPLAKTIALELGIDLRQVQGSGPGGRIVERDVRALAGGGASAADAVPEPIAAAASTDWTGGPTTALTVVPRGDLTVPGSGDEYEDQPITGIRRTIAERLTQAKRDIPHFRLTTSFNADPMLLFRKRLNELLGDKGKVTINDLLIKGVALALRRVPAVNAAFLGDVIRYYTRVHVGVAVALDRGLITPVIRNADLKGIGVIGKEVKDLVSRAKERKLKADDIQGSTFTISNLGMFGIDHFDAIINPPEAAILAVGRITREPMVDGDKISVVSRMRLTMSCDHRAVDGAVGARFLDELVDLLEKPESLAL